LQKNGLPWSFAYNIGEKLSIYDILKIYNSFINIEESV
jgi:hypothetical protein